MDANMKEGTRRRKMPKNWLPRKHWKGMIGATDAYKFREGERYTDFAYHLIYFFAKGLRYKRHFCMLLTLRSCYIESLGFTEEKWSLKDA